MTTWPTSALRNPRLLIHVPQGQAPRGRQSWQPRQSDRLQCGRGHPFVQQRLPACSASCPRSATRLDVPTFKEQGYDTAPSSSCALRRRRLPRRPRQSPRKAAEDGWLPQGVQKKADLRMDELPEYVNSWGKESFEQHQQFSGGGRGSSGTRGRRENNADERGFLDISLIGSAFLNGWLWFLLEDVMEWRASSRLRHQMPCCPRLLYSLFPLERKERTPSSRKPAWSPSFLYLL